MGSNPTAAIENFNIVEGRNNLLFIRKLRFHMFVAFNSLYQFSYSSDIKSHTFFLPCVCPSRRPRSDTQGVCDEADGPVPETCRDDSQQAPLTHAHTGPVGPNRHVLGSCRLHTGRNWSQSSGSRRAARVLADLPHDGHVKAGFLSTLKRTHTPEVHWLAFAELNKNQITLNKL